jgi:5-methylthioadenosine/S-adenosylhomocysteine deaminase
MRQAGVATSLATDGPVSGNDLDMWLTIRLAATLHKGAQQDPALISAREALRMATCEGAEALGLGQQVGRLESGQLADLILIDRQRPHLTPLYDVYSHLAYAVGRADVASVMINGQWIMRERQLTTLDEAEAMAGVEALARQIARDLG